MADALLLFLPLLCGAAGAASPASCRVQTSPCSCRTAGGAEIDLRPLSVGPAPRFAAAHAGFEYRWDPCRAFPCAGDRGAALCRAPGAGGGRQQVLGDLSSARMEAEGPLLALFYTAGGLESQVILNCAPNASRAQFAAYGRPPGGAVFLLTVTSQHACPRAPGGGGRPAISVGGVFLLALLLLLLGYAAVGVAVNVFVRHRSGVDAIPNRGFWWALPGLIRDGAKFAVSKARRRKDGDGYQAL